MRFEKQFSTDSLGELLTALCLGTLVRLFQDKTVGEQSPVASA